MEVAARRHGHACWPLASWEPSASVFWPAEPISGPFRCAGAAPSPAPQSCESAYTPSSTALPGF